MTTKHTPGPWNYREIKGKINVWTGEGMPAFSFSKTNSKHPRAWADARLIAAAPDLLVALKELQHAVHEARLLNVKKHFSLCVADAAAVKAIAKAEGKI